MTIGNKSTAIWPKLHDEQCIGYDAKGCYNHFLSDNPDFNGFEGKGYDTNFAHDVSYVFNEYGHRSLNDLPGVPVRYSEKHFLFLKKHKSLNRKGGLYYRKVGYSESPRIFFKNPGHALLVFMDSL